MKNLIDYLNDHLAGAVGALELLGHLIDHGTDAAFQTFCTRVRDAIRADVEELRGLIERCGAEESTAKKAAAWVAEKAARMKLQLGGSKEVGLGRLQALETLCLGITGKRALWTALRALEPAAAWQGMDLECLIHRAEEQWAWVEAERLKTARPALAKEA